MRKVLIQAAIAGIVAASPALPAGAETLVLVRNQTTQLIHPWFKGKCLGDTFNAAANADGWVFFGAIGSGSQFGWGFQEIVNPRCKHPKILFTYTVGSAAPLPASDLPKSMKYKFPVTDGVDIDPIVVGVGLVGPDLHDEDDD